MSMDLKTSKIELVKLILDINNSDFINKVKDFISNEKADFWNELSSSEQDEIRKGIKHLNEGKRVSYKDVMKKIS